MRPPFFYEEIPMPIALKLRIAGLAGVLLSPLA